MDYESSIAGESPAIAVGSSSESRARRSTRNGGSQSQGQHMVGSIRRLRPPSYFLKEEQVELVDKNFFNAFPDDFKDDDFSL